jgi:hypothetical protein
MGDKAVINRKNVFASIRSGLGFSFLLLACLVAIAHDFVPHCHHDNGIYLSLFHSLQSGASHAHDGCCGNYNHENGEAGDCNREIFILPARGIVSMDNPSFVTTPVFYFILPQTTCVPDCCGFVLPFRESIRLPFAYLSHITCSAGLRAPPFAA